MPARRSLMLPKAPAGRGSVPGSPAMATTTAVTMSRRGVLGSLVSLSLATLVGGCAVDSSDTSRSAFEGVNVARADEAQADVHGAG
ncbi:MAG: hypothetical protein IPG50_05035 [Myxococcales bacterium]|nr:hypothetical protein [Myxococcales bacterium]